MTDKKTEQALQNLAQLGGALKAMGGEAGKKTKGSQAEKPNLTSQIEEKDLMIADLESRLANAPKQEVVDELTRNKNTAERLVKVYHALVGAMKSGIKKLKEFYETKIEQERNKLQEKQREYSILNGKYRAAEADAKSLRGVLDRHLKPEDKSVQEATSQELQQWQLLTQGAYEEQSRLRNELGRYKRNTIIAYVITGAIALGTLAYTLSNINSKLAEKPAIHRSK